MVDLSVDIAGIRMKNPVMNCAGTWELDSRLDNLAHFNAVGAYVQKSITLNPRRGNEQPRVVEVFGGLLNSIGLQNVGVSEFVDKKIPELISFLKIPIIISIAGETIEDFVEVAKTLESKAGWMISGIEINISCPNVKGGMVFGVDPDATYRLTKAVKTVTTLPVFVKLTPNVTDIVVIARSAVEGGADAISLINTLKGAAFFRGGHDRRIFFGGYSGKAIMPIALRLVLEISANVNIPIVAMGGICNASDALDFLCLPNVLGIGVGTGNFSSPKTMAQIVNGIKKYFRKMGYKNIKEFKEKEAINA